MHSTLRVLAASGLALLVACGGDGTSPADAVLNQDVALYSADAAGQDIEFMRGPGGRFGMGLLARPGDFECNDVAPPGLTVTRTCEFYDADGNEQSAFEAGVTDKVVMHVEVDGTIDREDWSSTIHRVRDFTVTGLSVDTGTVTWDGSGSGSMSRIRQTSEGEVQKDMTSEVTVTDVMIPVPRAPDGWPLGGTITSSVSVTITGGPRDGETHTKNVSITFDGTQYASVTVDGETFTIDLADRCHAGREHRGPWGPGRHHGERD